jgi:hypothetical protein
MTGLNYGLKMGDAIYVSPIVFSLFQSDFDQMVQTLKVRDWGDAAAGQWVRFDPREVVAMAMGQT